MTFTDAAAEVLRQVGKPLHYKEITTYAIEKNLLSHVGKSPEVTMGARLAALSKKEGEEVPLVRVKPGVFALKEWEATGQLKEMLATGGVAPRASDEEFDEPTSVEEEPVAEGSEPSDISSELRFEEAGVERAHPPVAEAGSAHDTRGSSHGSAGWAPRFDAPESSKEAEQVAQGHGPQEVERADLAAAAVGVFEEEEDDDQPILTGVEASTDRDVSRRRRRRRRRSKGSHDGIGQGNGNLPNYTVTPALADATHAEVLPTEPRHSPTSVSAPHPVVLEVGSSSLDSIALDDFGGRDMADAIALVLGAFDRAAGPVSLRQIAEAAQRKGRVVGELQQLQSQIAASVRADNMRRVAAGQRPRFRFAGGKIALTDWLLTHDLARLEQEAVAAVERYREAARKAFVRKIQELPGHAFVELALLALERIGMSHMRAVRRVGLSGQEAHFSAIHKTGAAEIQTAIIIRRDGREVGREHVAELRGSLHHYGQAAAGWIITSGQVLSGAREEAGATSSCSMALLDGFGVAKLCEKHEIAVVQARLPVAIPDVDLLEALRAS